MPEQAEYTPILSDLAAAIEAAARPYLVAGDTLDMSARVHKTNDGRIRVRISGTILEGE